MNTFGFAFKDYKGFLNTPTYLTHLNGTYFLVDCWNHRILYSSQLDANLRKWRILDDTLGGPHSIATDGHVLVAEDTGRHRIITYRKTRSLGGDSYERHQVIGNVGIRPHRVLFDHLSETFLVVGSGDKSITILGKKGVGSENLHVLDRFILEELEDQYIRSITLHGENLYVVGSVQIGIYKYSIEPEKQKIKKGGGRSLVFQQSLNLHEKYFGSNDLYFFTNQNPQGEPLSGLFTSTPGLLLRFSALGELLDGTAQDLSRFVVGTPYYVSEINNLICIPEITEHSRICFWNFQGDDFVNTQTFLDSQLPSRSNRKRKTRHPV